MRTPEAAIAARLVLAFALTFALGFERELRGSPAGDRTFSLIGIATAVIGVLAEHGAPNALAGAVTGVGFIGGGVVFRQELTASRRKARWSIRSGSDVSSCTVPVEARQSGLLAERFE